MPRVRLRIVNPAKAQERRKELFLMSPGIVGSVAHVFRAEFERQRKAPNRLAQLKSIVQAGAAGTAVEGRVRRALQRVDREVPMPQMGDIWTEVDEGFECPEGGVNCRNCGDPEFKASCDAAGHCPGCGTKHGISPDSILVAAGLVAEEV